MMRTPSYILLLCLAPTLGACGSSNPAENKSGANTETRIGPQGGQIQLDSGFEISVPEGALTELIDISVAQLAERPESDAFSAHGAAFLLGPEGQQFAKPVSLKLPCDAVDLPAGMQLDMRAFTAPGGSSAYTELAVNQLSPTTISTETSHFSVFTAGMLKPTAVSAGERYPVALAADADYVYWTNSGNLNNQREDGNEGFVMRAAKNGGEAIALSGPLPDPRAIAVNASHIYWVNGGDSDGGVDNLGIPGSIMRADKDGTNAVELSAAGFPVSLAIDATHIYWGDADTHELWKMAMDGGAKELLTAEAMRPEFIALDASSVFWTSGIAGSISSVPKAGGKVSVLATGQTDAKGIALSESHVFWADAGAGVVRSVPKVGGSITDIANSTMPTDLALIGDELVFTDQMLGAVVRVPASGGTASVLVMDQALPWRVWADGSDLLWSNAGKYDYEGGIQRFAL